MTKADILQEVDRITNMPTRTEKAVLVQQIARWKNMQERVTAHTITIFHLAMDNLEKREFERATK